MAMRNPVGRVNYQPNSWGEGPRESPQNGFATFANPEEGPKVRLRPESFADHYSQARQFFHSQTPPEQRHIVMALTFELSKCENPAIRERMVSHLLNIDETLAAAVADKLGIARFPKPADPAISPRELPPSPALSILENGPTRFEGRKLGVLVSAGADPTLLKGLQTAFENEGATMDVVAPKVGGVEAGDSSWIAARHMIDGGPSVLFDAVALLLTEEGAERLTGETAACDFVADAFAHCKFIGFAPAAAPLIRKAGIEPDVDEGMIPLTDAKSVDAFIQACRKLRLWTREASVKL